jgi:hypothetical protein
MLRVSVRELIQSGHDGVVEQGIVPTIELDGNDPVLLA